MPGEKIGGMKMLVGKGWEEGGGGGASSVLHQQGHASV